MLFGRHQKNTILRMLPEAFRDIAKQSAGSAHGDMIPAPDQDKHVFCRVLADRGFVEMNASGYVFQHCCKCGNNLALTSLSLLTSRLVIECKQEL